MHSSRQGSPDARPLNDDELRDKFIDCAKIDSASKAPMQRSGT
jgi:hypothetical protein